jgi:hypothetical protein
MDSIAQLALISKAKKVFGTESTFLSFPVTPLAYQKDDLEFFSQKSASDLLKSKANLNAFSTLVNLIPRSEAWLQTDPQFLWDDYDYVLKQGVTAVSSRTPDEEIAFQEARNYLKEAGEGGIMQDSAAARVYKQYRDAYFITEQEYMEARVSGQATEDETEKQQWRDFGEPAYLEKLEELKNEWILEGFKNEVEIARETFLRLGAKSPVLTWADWRAQFNPDISSETGIDQSQVFLSCFMPSNALEDECWRSFSLNEAEVKSLIGEASADLRERYSVDGKETSIKSMSLEFSSAVIKRPWFDPQLFKSRFWKLRDKNKMLSNGTKPLSGDCPAYVTAVVFARNINVQQKKPMQAPTGQAEVNTFQFNHAIRDQRKIKNISPVLLNAIKPARLQMLDMRSPASSSKKDKPARMQALNMPPVTAMTLSQAVPKPQLLKMNVSKPMSPKTTVNPKAISQRNRVQGRAKAKPAVPSQLLKTSAMLNLQASEFSRLKVSPVMRPAARLATTKDSSIYIFAFICKPFPKCPDPDPTLIWS